MIKLAAWSFSVATLVLVAHLMTLVIIRFRNAGNARYFALFLSGCGAYVIHTFFNNEFLNPLSLATPSDDASSAFSANRLVFNLLWLWAEITPWALWVFLHRVCRPQPLPITLLSAPFMVILALNIYTLSRDFDAYPYLQISNFLNLLLLALAVHEALFDLQADLSNPRRKLRNLVAISLTVIVGLLFYIEVSRPTWTSDIGLLFSRVLGFCTAFIISVIYFRTPPDTLTELFSNVTLTPQQQPIYSESAQRLLQVMREDELYTTANLSLARLAEHLEIPEYRLRDIIKAELGYQNFNKFINRYRVKHAANALKTQPHLSIGEIMRVSGFNSHPPFHRAFRDHFQCTPAEYRESNS